MTRLPLAIVRAGRYMQETETSYPSYLQLYESSWSALQAEVSWMRGGGEASPALDVSEPWRSLVWFADPCNRGTNDHDWLGDSISQELRFKREIKRLLAYSLVELYQDNESYLLHPVVYNWYIESINRGNDNLIILALLTVEYTTPS